MFIWTIMIIFCNGLFLFAKEITTSSLETVVSDPRATGIFQYMAWFAIFRLLWASDPRSLAVRRDLLVTAALCLLVLLPTSRMIWIAALGVALYLVFFNGDEPKLRAAGTVLAGLSVQEFWGHLFFKLVSLPLLRAETAAVGTMLQVARPGTVWQENVITGPDGYGIVIYGGCSSFHNLSLAMLCWLTVSRLRHQNWRRRDFLIGGAVCGTIIVFNLIRLFLMAWDEDLFRYWHDGTGAEIFAIGASVTILLISLCGARSARQPA
jgi:exosortase/archaeosortase family protein